jgi:hypothetical protein
VTRQRAKPRANGHLRQATVSHVQPLSRQVSATPGHAGRRLAAERTRLTSEGSQVRTLLRPPIDCCWKPYFVWAFELAAALAGAGATRLLHVRLIRPHEAAPGRRTHSLLSVWLVRPSVVSATQPDESCEIDDVLKVRQPAPHPGDLMGGYLNSRGSPRFTARSRCADAVSGEHDGAVARPTDNGDRR